MARKDTLIGTQDEEYFSFKQSMFDMLIPSLSQYNHHATVFFFYALSIPTELSSRGHHAIILIEDLSK